MALAPSVGRFVSMAVRLGSDVLCRYATTAGDRFAVRELVGITAHDPHPWPRAAGCDFALSAESPVTRPAAGAGRIEAADRTKAPRT